METERDMDASNITSQIKWKKQNNNTTKVILGISLIIEF